jgi:hypothetical protein
MLDRQVTPSRQNVKKHAQHTLLFQPEKSSVAKHSSELGHSVNSEDTTVLARTMGHI